MRGCDLRAGVSQHHRMLKVRRALCRCNPSRLLEQESSSGLRVMAKLEKSSTEVWKKTSFVPSEKQNSNYTGKGALLVPWATLYDMGSNWIQMMVCGKLVLACGKLSSF